MTEPAVDNNALQSDLPTLESIKPLHEVVDRGQMIGSKSKCVDNEETADRNYAGETEVGDIREEYQAQGVESVECSGDDAKQEPSGDGCDGGDGKWEEGSEQCKGEEGLVQVTGEEDVELKATLVQLEEEEKRWQFELADRLKQRQVRDTLLNLVCSVD